MIEALTNLAFAATEQNKETEEIPVWSGDLRREGKSRTGTSKSSTAKGLNLIVIVCDTWRADHFGCYGSTRIKTPNLDKFAQESTLFTNAYADGLPTIPARRVYHTGKSILPDARWKPLANDDITLAEVLKNHDFTTGFIVDTYHHFKPDYNFHKGYDSWQWIRGQETDLWKSGPREEFNPRDHMPDHLWNEGYDNNMRQYLMNTQHRKGEGDYFCARTCRAAVEWLEQNMNNRNPFMLWMDMFDPHEPWDAPPRFQKMYRDEYPYERYLFGYGVRAADVRPEDLPVIRDLYAAEVTFSDYCIGQFLEGVVQLGLMDNTVIVFTSDHGTHLGEQGCVQKTPALLNSAVAQLPLIIKHPDAQFAGKRIDALVSATDYMPTFLGLLGIDDYQGADGTNVWKVAEGEVSSVHDRLFTVFGRFGAVRDNEWHYFQHIKGDDKGKGPCLYDLKNDPEEKRNVIKEHPQVAAQMRKQMENRLGVELPDVR
ncbi:sulfatase [Candidatus Poribacteria bacterium]|nr:sulfatase [Candidatus Poribacteria bacterium]